MVTGSHPLEEEPAILWNGCICHTAMHNTDSTHSRRLLLFNYIHTLWYETTLHQCSNSRLCTACQQPVRATSATSFIWAGAINKPIILELHNDTPSDYQSFDEEILITRTTEPLRRHEAKSLIISGGFPDTDQPELVHVGQAGDVAFRPRSAHVV